MSAWRATPLREARLSLLAAPLLVACAGPLTQPTTRPAPESAPQPWTVLSLGSAQDAGMPHLGCFAEICAQARADGLHAPVASLAIVGEQGWYLVDATPDLPAQVHRMGSLPRGILLTHAHIGHYTGLMYLGKEGMHAQNMPVWCSAAMAEFLSKNAPWSQLVALGNLELRVFDDGRWEGNCFPLESGLAVTALRVPHRDEFADTWAFSISHALSSELPRPVLYLPDIDRWQDWSEDIVALADWHSAVVVDGTFWDDGELGGRDMSAIPHPRARATMDLLQAVVDAGECEVVFTHLNHSNPLWNPQSPAYAELTRRGFHCTWPDGWSFALRVLRGAGD